jgi:putative ABC transport system permease protein
VSPARLVARSIRHHARASLALVAACAVATAVLVGSLAVGDSVQASLERIAERRIGGVGHAIQGRFVREQLAGDLRRELDRPVAGVVQLTGTAATADGDAATGGVQILGVDPHLEALLPGHPTLPSDDRSVVINAELAERLGAAVGDELLLKLPRPAPLSREAPFATDTPPMAGLRLQVSAVLGPADGGALHLRTEQRVPPTALVSLATIQRRIDRLGQIDLLLVAAEPPIEAVDVHDALDRHWRLADAGLRLRPTRDKELQLAADSIFLDPATEQAAAQAGRRPLAISGYMANELRLGEASEPYAFVAAVADHHGEVPGVLGMTDHEILLDEDTAAHLGARVGSEVELAWWRVEPGRSFHEQRRSFTVRQVLPKQGLTADPDLVPSLPGVSGVHSCADWAPGVPIELDRIGARQEQYWQQHGTAPRAIVTLAAGTQMWGGPHGDLTGVRYPAAIAEEIEDALLSHLSPADAGVFVTDLRRQATQATAQGLDFGGLVLGFAFFLEAAALLLVGLLFALAVHGRRREIGVLLGLGFRPGRVRALLLAEGTVLAAAGALPGAGLGVLFCAWMVSILESAWPAPGGLADLQVTVGPTSLLAGAGAGVLAAAAAVAVATGRLSRVPVVGLLHAVQPPVPGRGSALAPVAGAVLLAVGAAWALWPAQDPPSAERSLAAGALALAGGVLLIRRVLTGHGRPAGVPGRWSLARRSLTLHPGRTTATLGLVATTAFMVTAVESFRLDPAVRADRVSAGTGGYTLWAEAAVPLAEDPSSVDYLARKGLDPAHSITAVRVHAGDDASCLNLNRAQAPRVLGVPTAELHERGAFAFTPAGTPGWTSLTESRGDGAIPAIADMNTLQWALGIGVGDELTVTEAHGRSVTFHIVGALQRSVLQGALLVDEASFRELYPADDGYGLLLVDGPDDARELATALQDHGLDVTTTVDRLGAFHAVENIYLSMFQLLAALALLLGTAGLGIGLLRSVIERRGELAMLHAVGFTRGAVRGLVLREYALVLAAGLAVGLAAATLCTVPHHLAGGQPLPWLTWLTTAAAIGLGGCAGLAGAATMALRGEVHTILTRER